MRFVVKLCRSLPPPARLESLELPCWAFCSVEFCSTPAWIESSALIFVVAELQNALSCRRVFYLFAPVLRWKLHRCFSAHRFVSGVFKWLALRECPRARNRLRTVEPSALTSMVTATTHRWNWNERVSVPNFLTVSCKVHTGSRTGSLKRFFALDWRDATWTPPSPENLRQNTCAFS